MLWVGCRARERLHLQQLLRIRVPARPHGQVPALPEERRGHEADQHLPIVGKVLQPEDQSADQEVSEAPAGVPDAGGASRPAPVRRPRQVRLAGLQADIALIAREQRLPH